MQIEELSRPHNSGYWCGTSWGTNTYFSETSAITLMLRVFNLSQSHVEKNPGVVIPQDTVLLKLTYRFLLRQRGFLRYGAPYRPHDLGKEMPKTFCDRSYDNCDKSDCKIQSPNFPGMYPRNLTCYYHVRQTNIPEGKVALIRVSQKNPHLIYIKDRNAPHLTKERRFQLGDSCHLMHDYLMIFDGNTTRAPVLLKACKGSSLSPITASGPTILLLFHASPYDFPFQDYPRRKVFGFQLDVEVIFVDVESTSYVARNSTLRIPPSTSLSNRSPIQGLPFACAWEIHSHGQQGSGYIQAPAHSLLPNTTCLWRLSAAPGEVVWLYFLHYRNVIHLEMPPPTVCPNTLTIHDGEYSFSNATLLARVCRADKYPKVCSGVHAATGPDGAYVACPPSDSYISTSPVLTMALRYSAGTNPAHVEFLARYEFVNTRQWGKQTPEENECDRSFGPSPDRNFASPRNVFMFGRGGNKRLRCVYTFQAEVYQRISLRILRSRMGNKCSTVFKLTSRLNQCRHRDPKNKASLRITEEPWNGVPLSRGCLCDTSDSQPITITSYSNKIQLIFTIPQMTPAEDYYDFYFEGDYEVIEAPRTRAGELCGAELRNHQKRNGNFTVGAGGLAEPCAFLPRLVRAIDGDFLFMRIRGFLASDENCGVGSRINVYAVGGVLPMASVCPEPTSTYSHVFSSGWNKRDLDKLDNMTFFGLGAEVYINEAYEPKRHLSRDLIVEYTGNYSGRSLITWVGVWRPYKHQSYRNEGSVAIDVTCPYKCPTIHACLPLDLWCDGRLHCPSGLDESAAACGLLSALPWASLVAAAALLASLVILLLAVIIHKLRPSRPKPPVPPPLPQNNSSNTNTLPPKSNTHDLLLPPDKESNW